jgi:hypothetical protein
MLMECQEHLEEIEQNLNEAVKYLRSLFLAMAKLELAGLALVIVSATTRSIEEPRVIAG